MKFIYNYRFLFLALAFLSLVMPSCRDANPTPPVNKQVKDFDNKVLYDWNELFLEVERYAGGYRPGPAPRALAYIGIANYEGCVSGMADYNSIERLYSGLSIPTIEKDMEYHWPTVVNASYAYLMRRFFSEATLDRRNKMDALEAQYEAKGKAAVDSETFERSRAYGVAVATVVWEYSKTDVVGHNHYLDPFQGYNWAAHYSKSGDWEPTFPGPGKPMGGVWGKARTFAAGESLKICKPPLPYNESPTSDLYAQAIEVYAQNTPTLSYEDEWIGEFWSDDLVNLTFSPGPRWLAIGDEVLVLQKSNLETAIFMGIKLGMALNDASICCWNSKYKYNVERPQTYINRLIDPNWKPALYNPLTGEAGVTPSFPAYPSGHSTMGAAGAEVLASIFGYAYSMTDRCHETRTEFEGVPRTFGSFYEMANENAWSRVPLGVHFRMDCEEGVRYGTVIGRVVNDLPWKN